MTRKLGRGLDTLIPQGSEEGEEGLRELPLASVVPNPRQPRGDFDDAALEELAQSIRQVGVLQPIIVRPGEDGGGAYEIVAGERRYRAARLAGLEKIPAVIRATEDDDLLTEALVENIHRSDLNPLEEAAAYQQLLEDFELTHDELAERVGRSRSAISNALRLLGLPPGLQERVATGSLSAGHARALLALEDADLQERAAQRVVAEQLSVRATEEMVRELLGAGDGPRRAASGARRGRRPYPQIAERLSDALAVKVDITGGPRKGRLVIEYGAPGDLERLLDVLSRGTGEDLTREDPLA